MNVKVMERKLEGLLGILATARYDLLFKRHLLQPELAEKFNRNAFNLENIQL